MLIGISGKIGSGKDTIGKIIQYLTADEDTRKNINLDHWLKYTTNRDAKVWSQWEIKKFADKLKNMVCLLIGCTRAQLEDIDFKNIPLGKNWVICGALYSDDYNTITKLFSTYNERENWINSLSDSLNVRKTWEEELTPRKLLQLLGTECGRDIIHPNIWINALFADYKPLDPENSQSILSAIDYSNCKFPNWIITDVRFFNEAEAIKKRGGILIRVNRTFVKVGDKVLSKQQIDQYNKENPNTPYHTFEVKSDIVKKQLSMIEHPSETALDNYEEFDHIIDNNGTIEELVEKIKNLKLW